MTAPALEPALPALRLLPAPSNAPPYDDELGSPAPLRLVTDCPSRADLRPRLSLVPDEAILAADPPARDHLLEGPDSRTPSTELPEPRGFARAIVQGVLEIRAGLRPLLQLQRDTTPELYARLESRLTAMPRTTGSRPTRADVRSLHVQQRPDGVAEVCATVRRGRRMRALVLRLEGQHGRWVCTELCWL